MRRPAPRLGRLMVLLAAALASAPLPTAGAWGHDAVEYGQLGTDVVLPCAGGQHGRAGVQWQREGATLPAGSIVQLGALVLPHADTAAAGTYSCHGPDGRLLRSLALRLGHPPGVPSVWCRASDYENFSCSWAAARDTFLPTRYITTYRKKSLTGEEKRRVQGGPVGLCLQDPARPGTCTVPKSEFWSSYRLNVTEVNPLGASFRLLDVTMQAICAEVGTTTPSCPGTRADAPACPPAVKPDPPEGLVVEPVPQAPRRLRVHWQYPTSWPKEPHFQLKFRLQYRPVMHRAWSVVETANLSEVITDAFSGLEHVVQVGAKDFLDAGNWSEWSAEARATPVTVPPDPAATARTETTTETGPERLAHEPSPAPNPEPIDRSDPTERIAVLASLGVFACVVLAAVLFVALLVWRRARCQGKETPEKHDFLAAAVHLKALPKAQIL